MLSKKDGSSILPLVNIVVNDVICLNKSAIFSNGTSSPFNLTLSDSVNSILLIITRRFWCLVKLNTISYNINFDHFTLDNFKHPFTEIL